jgi:hypothetical protein
LSTRSHTFGRAFRGAAIVVSTAALAFAAAGCGGGGGRDEDQRKADALNSLYAIDHDGAHPTDGALAPYEKAFDRLDADCGESVEDLASSVLNVASDASNGSGTTITNLEAMRAVGDYLKQQPQAGGDCRGVFVGVEAYLEGGALGG